MESPMNIYDKRRTGLMDRSKSADKIFSRNGLARNSSWLDTKVHRIEMLVLFP
jgi:hypothetical protein